MLTQGLVPLMDEAQECSHFADFMAFEGMYTVPAGFNGAALDAWQWWSYYTDSPLYEFGRLVACMPCSTADIERVWSSAGFQEQDRPNLTHNHLCEEVSIRWNSRALKHVQQS